ncbi:hypothetical protein [Hymenobacter sp. BT559]|uniref:hypothetical protein n=1 Tax=Hymenobacter sp. BT559 TaxID=2795729 RepID=UPI0018EDAA77|nr:hypothetical protein [Hymenobacter sp. BT559]MBJ6142196.1 hypothetical protein [Hymenobacter sp. BT559]
MNNQHIANFLRQRRDEAVKAFQAAPNVHPRFQEAFASLLGFDFVAYRQQLHDEILQNVVLWQGDTNTEAKPLDAVLFEFNSIYEWAVEARAYGIVDWQKPEPQVSGFDMGYNLDFRSDFEAIPGLSLSFLQPLEDLLNPETIDELAEPEQDMEEVLGFQPLADAFLFSGLIVVHETLVELNRHSAFAKIGLELNGLFLLGGHDTGLVYPILSTSAN